MMTTPAVLSGGSTSELSANRKLSGLDGGIRPVKSAVGSDLRAWHRLWTDYGLPGIDVAVLGADPTLSPNSRQSGCRLVKRFRWSGNSLREPKRQEKRLSWASRKTVSLNYQSGQSNPKWA